MKEKQNREYNHTLKMQNYIFSRCTERMTKLLKFNRKIDWNCIWSNFYDERLNFIGRSRDSKTDPQAFGRAGFPEGFSMNFFNFVNMTMTNFRKSGVPAQDLASRWFVEQKFFRSIYYIWFLLHIFLACRQFFVTDYERESSFSSEEFCFSRDKI